MQKLNMTHDGVLYRATAQFAPNVSPLALAVLATSTLPHVQVGTKAAKVRVFYTTAARPAIDAAIAAAEAEVATAGGTAADVLAILTAPGETVAFLPWSLGEVPADANRSDYFEAPVSAILFYCDISGASVIDRTATATVIQ